jgi:hypothetical protein
VIIFRPQANAARENFDARSMPPLYPESGSNNWCRAESGSGEIAIDRVQ